jgi:NAD-dependent dihydropyrimidine dehydrogenase PreA subunit
MMGSGGMIVMDEDTCAVDIARYYLDFLKGESCGKCTPCREGVERMHAILTRISEGKAIESDIHLLEELAKAVVNGALCALGGTAPNPVITTLRYFREEYEVHIRDKKCPAGVCRALITYSIDPDKCKGCTLCAKQCPQRAISGERKEVHVIDQSNCIKCGVCLEACKFNAVKVQ